MTLLRESEAVPLLGVGRVEREGQGKTVVSASVRLEERQGPTPPRRVVSIETRDGAIYRFQRYGRDEFLAFYNRENPDGSEFKRKAALPTHVQDVREAIMSGDVLPDFAAMLRAEKQVGEREYDSSDGATDADVRRAIEDVEREERRREEADLRSGYAIPDGGVIPTLDGLEVAHFARSSETWDVYGGRRQKSGGDLAHAANTDPGSRGWLGNPFQMDGKSVEERKRVIAAFTRYFLDRVADDDEFREAVEDLRGKRVSCWCRGVSQERTPERWCHLDVVDAWLTGDLTPVYDYLRRDLE